MILDRVGRVESELNAGGGVAGTLGATYPAGVDSTANSSSRSDSTAFQIAARDTPRVVGERWTGDRAVDEGVEQCATRVHVDGIGADAQSRSESAIAAGAFPAGDTGFPVKRRVLSNHMFRGGSTIKGANRSRRKTQGLTGEFSGMQPSKEQEASDDDPMDDLDDLLDDDLAGGEGDAESSAGTGADAEGVSGTSQSGGGGSGGGRIGMDGRWFSAKSFAVALVAVALGVFVGGAIPLIGGTIGSAAGVFLAAFLVGLVFSARSTWRRGSPAQRRARHRSDQRSRDRLPPNRDRLPPAVGAPAARRRRRSGLSACAARSLLRAGPPYRADGGYQRVKGIGTVGTVGSQCVPSASSTPT